ncbi:MAG: hypothetical protein ACI4FZ_08750 [Lachnospiraceae bacterium]
MAKLERKALAHYLDSSFGGVQAAWFLLGADLEELSVELNPDVESVTNILGETSVRDNGYEPSATADPYYANPEDAIYEKIRDIALERKKGDACKTKILEVIIEDTKDASHLAFVEDVIVKPTSYGGGTDGVAIPFDVHFAGNRKKGTVTITEGVPVFTEGTEA